MRKFDVETSSLKETFLFKKKPLLKKKGKMAEYYLIGTLVSITFALLVGIVVRAILMGGI